MIWALIAMAALAMPADPAVLAAQWEEYQAEAPKTIIDLQPFRQSASGEFQMAGDWGQATLVNLNPQINAWFLLTLWWPGAPGPTSYHLENPSPKTQTLALSEAHPYGIRLSIEGRATDCELWPAGRTMELQQARHSDLPYAPLCGDRLYLRNPVSGTYTHLERVTNFLRDHVWGGEQIVGFVKNQFFADAFIETDLRSAKGQLAEVSAQSPHTPRAASIAQAFAAQPVIPEHLGIDIGQASGGVTMGQWYPVRDAPGIFVSVIRPQAIETGNSRGAKAIPADADSIGANALDYMVALDLAQFNLGFALGTDHPRVGWSERALESVRNPRLPGPDGIGGVAPLVVNGMVNPQTVERTAATFAGGFKREHGAFRYGPLAQRNHGTHYGFIEQGVVFSKLQPELSTLWADDAGEVRMKTWTADDASRLPHIKFARQNGVPLIEYDERTGVSSPGALIDSWGPGNWSGSEDERLRTLRAGVCLQETGGERFLIYGYFSTATPHAMARVFQAYACRYAMHLDMNALEHTYFAIYTHKDARIVVEHLIEGMAEVDRKGGDELAPRFLSFPDDRDFFYATRKN
ncbi:MAG: hypothetical protein WA807_11015 [Steroidobacteraceae bacterium]